ncbi:hypothetical protein FDP41_000671 [Naegleria fowleri]|uniref:Uncharacterized protein n=1 Tax=Naegleria fowleri TaxID=5763 RepID=A0A6A5CCF4_NAEFO|nr:uncharacterized protein FDP41_000671 [Naegleria fowleri]KAF0984772.1 hypothetical protein FDP41_000671 [Naegleria fowleri]
MGSAFIKFSCSKVSDSNVHDHSKYKTKRQKKELKTFKSSSTPSNLSFKNAYEESNLNSSTPVLMNLCPSAPTLNDTSNAEDVSNESTNASPRRGNKVVPLSAAYSEQQQQPESSPLIPTSFSFRSPSFTSNFKFKKKAASFFEMKKSEDLVSPTVNNDPVNTSSISKYDDSSYFDNYHTLPPIPIDEAVLQKVMTRNRSAGNVLRESLEVFRFGAAQQNYNENEDIPMDDDEIKSVETVSTTSSSTVEVEIFNHSGPKAGLMKTKSSYRLERTGSGVKKPQLSSFHRFNTISDIHRALVEEHQKKALSKHSSIASIRSKYSPMKRDSLDSQVTTSSGTGTSGSGSVRSPTPRVGRNMKIEAKVTGTEALLCPIPEERHLVASMSLNNLFSNKMPSSTRILDPVSSNGGKERRLTRNFSSNQIITSSLLTQEKQLLSQSSQDLLRDLKKPSIPKTLQKTSSFRSTTSNTSTVSKEEILNRVFNTAPSRPTLPPIKRKKKESRLIIDPKTGSIKYTDEEDVTSEKSSSSTTRSDFSSLDETKTNLGNSDIMINIQEPKEAPEVVPKSAPKVTLRQLKLQKIQKLKEQKETEEMLIAYIMDDKYSEAEINNYLLSIGSHEFMDIF